MSSPPAAYATILWSTFEYQLSDTNRFPAMKREMIEDLRARGVEYHDVEDDFWTTADPSKLKAPVITLVYEHGAEVNNQMHKVLEEKNKRELQRLVGPECVGNPLEWTRQASKIDFDCILNKDMVKQAYDAAIDSGDWSAHKPPGDVFIIPYTKVMFEKYRPDIIEERNRQSTVHLTSVMMEAHQNYDERFNPIVLPKAHLEWYLGMIKGTIKKDVSRYGM